MRERSALGLWVAAESCGLQEFWALTLPRKLCTGIVLNFSTHVRPAARAEFESTHNCRFWRPARSDCIGTASIEHRFRYLDLQVVRTEHSQAISSRSWDAFNRHLHSTRKPIILPVR